MGLFGSFVEGVFNGLEAARVATRGQTGVQVFESCCAQLGWGIDERLGNGGIVLHFKDPLIGIRKVLITCGDSGQIATLGAFSAASLPARKTPPELTAYLLDRNRQMPLPAWQMSLEDGNVTFAAFYCVLLQGLTPALLKHICEATVKEVHDFDSKLRQGGLL